MEISKRRVEMGEDAWAEYQKQRQNDKAKAWKARNVDRVVDWRRRTKEKLVAYKGGKCELCGFNKPFMSCYDFHHRDPSKKDFGIAGKGTPRKYELLLKEVDKCMLLCRNCHAEIHDKEYEAKKQNTRMLHINWLENRIKERVCTVCQKTFKPERNKRVFCSVECSNKSRVIPG